MADLTGFVIESGLLTRYEGPGGRVLIPEGVTRIGDGAFKGCAALVDLTIPEGVTHIGKNAFANCEKLTGIAIPASVVSLGEDVFYGCHSLSRVVVSSENHTYSGVKNAVLSKDGRTLVACAGVTGTYVVPPEVDQIGRRAFSGCRRMTGVAIYDGVTEIGDGAFMFCTALSEIAIPGSVKRVGEMAFWYCDDLAKAALGTGVEEIDDEAFRGCKCLGRVTLPGSLARIGERAFCECWSLARIAVPEGVTRIGSWTFRECRSLTGVTLPKSLTEIDDEAFSGCYSLPGIVIPSGVTRIGREAFAWCYRLKGVALPGGLRRIEAEAFYGCAALEALPLPEGLTRIGESAFSECKSLTELTLPQSVRDIGRWTFKDCKSLAQVTVTDSVEDFSVFWGCTALEAYVVSPASRRYSAVDGVVFSRDGRRLIAYPPGRRRERYDIPGNVVEFPASAFDTAPVKVVFAPKGVKLIPTYTTGAENSPCFASGDSALTAQTGRNVYLGPLDDLPKRQKRIAAEGFLVAVEIGMPELEPWKNGYIDTIRQEYATWEKKAWKDETLLRLLMENGMLKPETAKVMRRKFEAGGKTDLVEALDDYLAAHTAVDGKGMEDHV